ncbi:MAG: uroporphyrinogen decarboxylase [Propionibacteriaceae bacterium]|nr:uroporphyrinogen decarboxylase [Propionibacteriaceae bacterium]
MTQPALIQAYRGNRTTTRPVWFMRQAGRSLPEYRAAREGTQMLEACLTPELAATITVQPVRRHRVDAAIFFSDIMIPAKCAGVDVEIVPGRGPVLNTPVRTAKDVDGLPELTPEALAPIVAGVQASIAMLGDTPLIGFAGAPFTVASYLVEGEPSRAFPKTKALMAEDPDTWEKLARWVARTTQAFLAAQIEAGAQAIQLFDSWVGALTVEEYLAQAQPYSALVFEGIAASYDVPRVHFGTGTAHLLTSMLAAGATVMGVDVNLTLEEASEMLGGNVPLQGNIDPSMLTAPWEELEAHVRSVLTSGQSAPGHVVNLGHGVPPTTDPDVLTRIVELIHSIPDTPLGETA